MLGHPGCPFGPHPYPQQAGSEEREGQLADGSDLDEAEEKLHQEFMKAQAEFEARKKQLEALKARKKQKQVGYCNVCCSAPCYSCRSLPPSSLPSPHRCVLPGCRARMALTSLPMAWAWAWAGA